MNELFLLNVPPHWCYHRMTDSLNGTQIEAWKECYLPKNDIGSYDSCHITVPKISMDSDSFWNLRTFDSFCPIKTWQNTGAAGGNNQSLI